MQKIKVAFLFLILVSPAVILGTPGTEGLQGASGQQGDPGDPGTPGFQGTRGDPGLQGERGDPGVQGPLGGKGLPGVQGQVGYDGPRGQKGIPVALLMICLIKLFHLLNVTCHDLIDLPSSHFCIYAPVFLRIPRLS